MVVTAAAIFCKRLQKLLISTYTSCSSGVSAALVAVPICGHARPVSESASNGLEFGSSLFIADGDALKKVHALNPKRHWHQI